MEEVYDYSRHRYCILIDFGYDIITSKAEAINKPHLIVERSANRFRTSILYDTTTRNIIARGNMADEENENLEDLQKGVIYIRNTLSELADIYLKSKQQSFDTTAPYVLLYEEAIDLLQKILDQHRKELNSVNMDFFYSLNLPTSWDYELREELFLPLFVKAGLLHENDGPGRLVFYSMLDVNFQNMQMEADQHDSRNIMYGDQRVMCTLDYQDTYSLDLKLVSAQYPAFRLANRELVPQLLKQAHIVIPFGLKELRLSLIACVEKHYDTTLSSESIDDILEKLNQEYKRFYSFGSRSRFLGDQPLPDLKSRWTNKPITLEDILEHFFGHAEKFFRSEVDKFLVGRSNTVPRPLDIFWTSRIPETFLANGLMSSVDCWSEKYFWELTESYTSAEICYDLPVSKHVHNNYREYATQRLLNYRMEEFNLRRNPVILPNETAMEEPKSCLKPIIFINIGSNWRANNIWYSVSMDKKFLDTVFGSIKKLEKLFFASGILRKDDELRKAKFCTRGEEILPAIQHKYQHLDFRLKSYFVVVQIFSKHIQLSLHQVVKLASPGEDPASIIVQDKIIHIDDVYDTLCKSIMKSIQVNCQVDYCTTHKIQEDTQYHFQSFEIYSNIYRNLKPYVVELFEKNKSNLNMDSKIQLDFNTKCGCSISIFLRDIIETGLMSVIESMATDIVASLTNKKLFGNYVPNYIFVFGDPFNLGQGSKIHIVFTMLMQKTIDDGVYIKEKDTKTFVLRESIFKQLQTFVSEKKPYMFDRFVTGTLCQVSSNTYGLRIKKELSYECMSFTRLNSDGDIKNTVADDGDIKNTVADDGSYFVFIQKGKPVPTKRLILQNNEPKNIKLEILQLESSTSTVPDKYTLLHGDTPGANYVIYLELLTDNSINTIVVEYRQISNYLSIIISRGYMVYIDNYIDRPHYSTKDILEPLTLAYI
ncbi:uncharacterized protein EV154DRAFT_563383 [Mucor mucedo]|uniref:uncharacterized protein n=1 Tax=Mucor mucedo TaxID=29922 RepID=UPI00221E82B1|nr:uncharacterized protein EV154DRAFT_563383 [Mucor mucedo]KAI7891464.1 hypothetical protein EV154DRAFT_563383 [Mucor mucedo]